jgi:chromosome segregation protein
MYLKSIELSGFKSFAKKSELVFSSRVTSIVGPNGSGKSNVAEAFRFVLGEQSIKSLRGKKGEDLIFNGAGGEPRANRASVKVVFDNSEKTFAVDFPEVAVERVVLRDGVNEYLINGSQVRLKDVLELLASAHIGSSGHHIISQGEADKILNASAKERKAMIEDALGLKIYQYKRIESDRKLKKTFENIAQAESLRREIAPHLKFLARQVEKVEKAESQKQELIKLAQEYFKREDLYISLTRAELRNERQPIEKDLERLSSELKEAKSVLEKSAEGEKKNFAVLELEAEIAGARVHKDALTRELGKIEGLIGAEERIIAKERELQTSEEHKTIRLREVEDLFEEISALSVIETIISRIRDFIRERKHMADSSVILDAEKRLLELKSDKARAEESLRNAEDKEKSLLSKYEDLKKEIEAEKDSSRDAEKAVFRIMSEENELISKLNLIKVREEKMDLEEAEFKRELEEVGRLVGIEALHYRNFALDLPAQAGENAAFTEDRSAQDDRKRAIGKLKVRLEDAGVSGGEEVMKEYQETSERDQFLGKELLDLEQSAESLKVLIKDLEERLATEFKTGIDKINREFSTLFTKMFGGGEAQLMLVKEKKKKVEALLEGDEDVEDEDDDDEVVQEGLDITVSLPRKKMMLSGGERALTSIALLFAISAVNPPPFIILDETDAALDEANSKRYGDIVERLSEHSQLILITHNRETMSRAGVIYGVTMGSTGVSKLLSIAFDEAVAVAK